MPRRLRQMAIQNDKIRTDSNEFFAVFSDWLIRRFDDAWLRWMRVNKSQTLPVLLRLFSHSGERRAWEQRMEKTKSVAKSLASAAWTQVCAIRSSANYFLFWGSQIASLSMLRGKERAAFVAKRIKNSNIYVQSKFVVKLMIGRSGVWVWKTFGAFSPTPSAPSRCERVQVRKKLNWLI